MDVKCPNCDGFDVTKVWADKAVLTFACNSCGEEFEYACDPSELDDADATAESLEFMSELGYSAELSETGGNFLLEFLLDGEYVSHCWCGSREDAIAVMSGVESLSAKLSPGAVIESPELGRRTVMSVSDGVVRFADWSEPQDVVSVCVPVAAGNAHVEMSPLSFSVGDRWVNAKGVSLEVVSERDGAVTVRSVVPGNSVQVTESVWQSQEFATMLSSYGYESCRENNLK